MFFKNTTINALISESSLGLPLGLYRPPDETTLKNALSLPEDREMIRSLVDQHLLSIANPTVKYLYIKAQEMDNEVPVQVTQTADQVRKSVKRVLDRDENLEDLAHKIRNYRKNPHLTQVNRDACDFFKDEHNITQLTNCIESGPLSSEEAAFFLSIFLMYYVISPDLRTAIPFKNLLPVLQALDQKDLVKLLSNSFHPVHQEKMVPILLDLDILGTLLPLLENLEKNNLVNLLSFEGTLPFFTGPLRSLKCIKLLMPLLESLDDESLYKLLSPPDIEGDYILSRYYDIDQLMPILLKMKEKSVLKLFFQQDAYGRCTIHNPLSFKSCLPFLNTFTDMGKLSALCIKERGNMPVFQNPNLKQDTIPLIDSIDLKNIVRKADEELSEGWEQFLFHINEKGLLRELKLTLLHVLTTYKNASPKVVLEAFKNLGIEVMGVLLSQSLPERIQEIEVIRKFCPPDKRLSASQWVLGIELDNLLKLHKLLTDHGPKLFLLLLDCPKDRTSFIIHMLSLVNCPENKDVFDNLTALSTEDFKSIFELLDTVFYESQPYFLVHAMCNGGLNELRLLASTVPFSLSFSQPNDPVEYIEAIKSLHQAGLEAGLDFFERVSSIKLIPGQKRFQLYGEPKLIQKAYELIIENERTGRLTSQELYETLQKGPEMKPLLTDRFLSILDSKIDPQIHLKWANYFFNEATSFGFTEEDKIFLRMVTIKAQADFDEDEDEDEDVSISQNPYVLFEHLKQTVPNEPWIDIAPPVESIDLRSGQAPIDVIWDIDALRARNTWKGFHVEDLQALASRDQEATTIERLLTDIERLENRIETDRSLRKAIKMRYGMPYSRIKDLYHDSYMISLLRSIPWQTPSQKIGEAVAHLFAAVRFLLKQPSDQGALLSPREEAILAFGASVQNCFQGKKEGMEIYHNNHLPWGERIPHSIDSRSGAVGKVESDYHKILQGVFNNVFSGEALSKEIIGDDSLAELAQFSSYLKNRFYRQAGLKHTFFFDIGTEALNPKFLETDPKIIANAIYRHFPPSAVMNALVHKSEELFRNKLFYGSFKELVCKGEGISNGDQFDKDRALYIEFGEDEFGDKNEPRRMTPRGALALMLSQSTLKRVKAQDQSESR